MNDSPPPDKNRHFLHYALARKLGEGKNGETWQALDTGLERVVVLKLFHSGRRFSEAHRRDVLDASERLCRRPGSPFARYLDWGEHEGRQYVVRDFVEGVSLSDRLPLSPEKTYAMALALAEALSVAHRLDIALDNITPTNILLDTRGRVHIVDHGLRLPGTAPGAADLAYTAPELLAGQSPGPRTDLYALGAVLFEVLEGRPAFADMDGRDPVGVVMTGRPDFGRLSAAGAPPEWRLVIEKLMAREPADRFSDAAELTVTLAEMRRLAAELPHRPGDIAAPGQDRIRLYFLLSVLALLLIILWLVLTTVNR